MYYIGIDIGGMTIKGGIVDEDGKIYIKDAVETKPERNYPEIVKDIADLCDKLCRDSGIKRSSINSIGMGIPGTINGDTGVITYANNINFEKVPIVKEFGKYYRIPVFIGNDANCAALGEVTFGENKGYKDAILITLGTGVGSGIIVDGRMLVGKNGAGAEGGHIGLKIGGELCSCGRRGCWEAYASATALIKMCQKAMDKHPESLMHQVAAEEGKISGKTAFVAMEQGDKTAASVVRAYTKNVAEGLVSLVNIFRPEVIYIGGGISNVGAPFFEKLQRYVSRYSYGGSRNPKVKILKASLKNDAGILGAAALCL